jgi:hypothetical protein
MVHGMHSGFELLNNVTTENDGGTRCSKILWPNCSACPCKQPLAIRRMLDSRTIQLNTTFVSGTPAVLRYGWGDYPTMILFGADGRPAPPFNVSVSGKGRA